MRQKESILQKRVRASINAIFPKKAYTIKTHGDRYTAPGIPDILACVMGVFIGIECKMWRGRPSEAQIINLRDINRAGGIGVYLIWNTDEGIYYWVDAEEPFTYRARARWIQAGEIAHKLPSGKTLKIIDCTYLMSRLISKNTNLMEKINNANKN